MYQYAMIPKQELSNSKSLLIKAKKKKTTEKKRISSESSFHIPFYLKQYSFAHSYCFLSFFLYL